MMKNAKGYWCRRKAATVAIETGLSVNTVIDYWKLGKVPERRSRCSSFEKTAQVDLCLAIMEALNERNQTHTHKSIAEVCGTTRQAIWHIENKALRKIRNLKIIKKVKSECV